MIKKELIEGLNKKVSGLTHQDMVNITLFFNNIGKPNDWVPEPKHFNSIVKFAEIGFLLVVMGVESND